MANRFIDSVGHYLTAHITKKYNSLSAPISVVAGASPRGTPVLRLAGDSNGFGFGYRLNKTINDQPTFIVGYRVKVGAFTSSYGFPILLRIFDGIAGADQFTMQVQPDGRLQVKRGDLNGTILGAASGSPLFTGVFAFIEVKVTIHPSAGSIHVRVDNSEVITLTGINTRATANNSASMISFLGGCSADVDMCDVYIHDGTGGVDDDFWGDTQIDYLKPIADGPVNDYTPVGSSNHFENVDELDPDTSDYNSDNNAGDLEYYQMQTISGTPIIKCIQSVGYLEKTDGNDRKIQYAVRESSTNHLGSIQDVPSSPGYLLEQWGDDPGTSADWLVAAANAARWGVKTNT